LILVPGTTDMATIGVLIVAILFLTALRHYENWLTNQKNTREDAAFRESLPIGMYHEDDVVWANRMLEMGGVKKAVDLLCSCGYAEDCAMHCNHERHPDCTGPNYFVLNGLNKNKSKPVWSGRFLATQTPDLIEYNPLIDAMIMTKTEARQIQWDMMASREKAESLAERKKAFQAKIMARHQARLKELVPEKSGQLALWPRGMI